MILIQESMPGKLSPFPYKYCEILKANNIPYETIDCHGQNFWERIKDASLFLSFLWQAQGLLLQQRTLINVIDNVLGITCFPDWNTSWHFEDKVSQYYLLSSQGYPIIRSHVFWDHELAVDWLNNADFPQIFKLKGGAGSVNVVKVSNKSQGLDLVNKMFKSGIPNGRVPGTNLRSVYRNNYPVWLKNEMKYYLTRLKLRNAPYEDWTNQQGYAYFQDFLPDNRFDTRITVIGDRAFGFIRHNRPNDFRSSGSGKIDYSPQNIDVRVIKMAFNVSSELSFKTMAYDFLIDNEGSPLINEMCCQFSDWAISKCPGYWDKDLNWHEGNYWPQYLQLCDILNKPDLKQPNFDKSPNTRQLIKVKQ